MLEKIIKKVVTGAVLLGSMAVGGCESRPVESSRNLKPEVNSVDVMPYTNWSSFIDENDFSLKVSKSVMDILKREYDQDEEDGFILLANMKTGVIDKVTDKYVYKSYGTFGFEPGFIQYLEGIARENGYMVVGFYHSHPGPRTYDPSGGPSNSGDFLSGDDCIYSGNERGLDNDVLRFLGNGYGDVPFKVRAFLPVNRELLGEGHPYLSKIPEFKKRGMIPKSRYDGSSESDRDIFELKIKEVDSEVDPTAEDMLSKKPPFRIDYEVKLDKATYISAVEAISGVKISGKDLISMHSKDFVRIHDETREFVRGLPDGSNKSKLEKEKFNMLENEWYDKLDFPEDKLDYRLNVKLRQDGKMRFRFYTENPVIEYERKTDSTRWNISLKTDDRSLSGSYRDRIMLSNVINARNRPGLKQISYGQIAPLLENAPQEIKISFDKKFGYKRTEEKNP